MAYDPVSPTLRVCDQLATYLIQQWSPNPPDTVKRAYNQRIDLSTVKGRLVLITPAGYVNEPADRGKDFYTHRIVAVVFERYCDQADDTLTVPVEWIDRRVDFVQQFIAEGFDFTHDTTYGAVAPFNRQLRTISTDVPDVFDPDLLQQRKEFWCPVECVFEELVT